MYIIQTNNYKKDYKKKIVNKHLNKEMERINNIENLIISCKTMQDVINSPFKNVYYIEKKHNDLKEFYTARINQKLRLIMKPIGIYPYDLISIEYIEFINIDDKHYGEG